MLDLVEQLRRDLCEAELSNEKYRSVVVLLKEQLQEVCWEEGGGGGEAIQICFV